MEQIKDKSKIRKRRVGLVARDGPPPRGHMEIQSESGEKLGEITSGCPSPSMAPLNIAMGYVQGDQFGPGTKVNIKVRNKLVKAEIVKMPFVKGKYYMPPKK
jgi:aminomethyltransferase